MGFGVMDMGPAMGSRAGILSYGGCLEVVGDHGIAFGCIHTYERLNERNKIRGAWASIFRRQNRESKVGGITYWGVSFSILGRVSGRGQTVQKKN
jgi:hypothetical protein